MYSHRLPKYEQRRIRIKKTEYICFIMPVNNQYLLSIYMYICMFPPLPPLLQD